MSQEILTVDGVPEIKPLNLLALSLEEPKPTDYVLPSLPLGEVGILSGTGGTGKSMLALQLALAVAGGPAAGFGLGGQPWGGFGKAGKVVFLSAEDKKDRVHERIYSLRKWYCETGPREREWLQRCDNSWESALGNLKVYSLAGLGMTLMNSDGKFSTTWSNWMSKVCKGARLVIIDTMRRVHDADENDNGKMSRFLKLIEQIAKESGAAIVILQHENKAGLNSSEAGQGAIRGASAIVDNARWVARLRHMTVPEAEERGMTDEQRIHWAALSVPKANYGSRITDVWLQRSERGVLEMGTPPEAAQKVSRANGRRSLEAVK